MLKGFHSVEGTPPAASLADAAPAPLPPVNILLVDDDPRNLNVLESILNLPEYRLVRATGADEALRALVSETFALLVLDVRMPDMDGLELAQLIKQRKKTQHLPIIFLTAYYHEDEHVLLGYGAGAVDYLNKPCNPAVLRSKVAVFVDLFRANQALKEEVAERRQAEERLAERSAEVQQLVLQLRALASELTQTEQRERRRLSRILHDHIQQLLVSAKMHLSLLEPSSLQEEGVQTVQEVESILSEAIAVARSVTVELSPPILQEGGLGAALKWLGKRMAEKYRFQVDVTVEPEAEPVREDERFLLFECVRELLFNAFKHAGVPKAAVHVSRGEGCIQIMVWDEGKGFDLEEFEGRSLEQSTFGLFSIQQRLAHLGGTMEIVTASGQGMRITLRTPLESPPPPPATEMPPLPLQDSGFPRQGGRIGVLVVDDHTIMRQGLIGLLRGEPDIEIVGEAGDGVQARELTRQLQPQVILMDMNLGEVSGLHLTRMILQAHPSIRIIGLSMHDDEQVAAAMLEAGAVAYFTKGVQARELIAQIRACQCTATVSGV